MVLKDFADVQGERRGDRKADQVAERCRNRLVRNRKVERKILLFREKFICEACVAILKTYMCSRP